jgi:hypothetical protein
MHKIKEKYITKIKEKRNIANYILVSIPIIYFLKNFESTSSEIKFFQILVVALVIVLLEISNQKGKWNIITIILLIIFLYIQFFSINYKSATNVSTNVNYSNYHNNEVVSTIRFFALTVLFAFAYKILARKKNDQ